MTLFVANVSIATLSIIAFTTSCYEDGRGKCLYSHDRERCVNVLLPCLATDTYGCKKPQHLQRQTSNGCNTLLQRDFLQPLAMNVIWLQHLPFATKLSLLQRFFVIAQGLEVSSVFNLADAFLDVGKASLFVSFTCSYIILSSIIYTCSCTSYMIIYLYL